MGTGSGYAGTISAPTSPAVSGRWHAIPQDPDNIFTADTRDDLRRPERRDSIKFFDVKATEAGIHNVFNFGLSTTVNAHSRVELKAVNELNGLLPLGVPDVRPGYVFAKFVAETGTSRAPIRATFRFPPARSSWRPRPSAGSAPNSSGSRSRR